MNPHTTNSSRIAGVLLLVSGVLFLAAGVLFDARLLRYLLSEPLTEGSLARIAAIRLALLAIGAPILAAGELLRRERGAERLRSLFRHEATTKLLLAGLVIATPLLLIELTARPFVATVHRAATTSLFIRDPALGWRLRPGARDRWGGSDVIVNDRGLVGPELPYARSEGRTRILFLGDSVTFGYRLQDVTRSYPFRIHDELRSELGVGPEIVNTAVGGYSPWQYRVVLEGEGLRYQPDLVILGFVLNDVTEKYTLRRFGGSGEGWQLAHSSASWNDWLKHRSAVVALANRVAARIRFGHEPQQGAAAREATEVQHLVTRASSSTVREMWSATLSQLEEIVTLAQSRDLPVVLVVFPYAFQLEAPEVLNAPQEILAEFCRGHDLHCLDLLPVFHRAATRPGSRVADFFVDPNHLSERGHALAARTIAGFVLERDDLRRRLTP